MVINDQITYDFDDFRTTEALGFDAHTAPWHHILFYDGNQNTMNILLILTCFVILYGMFALIAFKIVKVLFPDNDSENKRWRIKTPEAHFPETQQ